MDCASLDRYQCGTADVWSNPDFAHSAKNALAYGTDREAAKEFQLLIAGRNVSRKLKVYLVDAGNTGRPTDLQAVKYLAGALRNLFPRERIEGRGVSAGRRVVYWPQTESVRNQKLSRMGRILLRYRGIIRCVLNYGVPLIDKKYAPFEHGGIGGRQVHPRIRVH